jgi:DNA-binding transcriptional ArsR family regulator
MARSFSNGVPWNAVRPRHFNVNNGRPCFDLTDGLNHTEKEVTMQLDLTYAALADPTRRAILERLADGPAPVGTLAAPFAVSAPAISRHLKVLEGAGLLLNQRAGKGRLCALQPKPLVEAQTWLDFHHRFWTGSFDRLDALLKGQP